MKALVIDPRVSGISGDMLLSALVDLTGAPDSLEPVAGAIRSLPGCHRLSYEFRKVSSRGFAATCLGLEIDEDRMQPKELHDAAEGVSREAGLPAAAREKAVGIVDDLILTGTKLHPHGFHDHGIVSLDTLFDVVGSVLLLSRHGFLAGEVYGTPPALGGGLIHTDRGEVAVPAPATLEILSRHRIPCSSFPSTSELTTPTGAALLAHLAGTMTEVFPAMTPIRSGYGIGTGFPGEEPGMLRVIEGTTFRAIQDRIIMLETNLDDISGETIGYTMERLREAGAVDVFITPAHGKKNRPVHVVHVICPPREYERILATLMDETGTLGVRILDQPRLVALRENETRRMPVGGKSFDVRVKTSTVDGRIISVKPEYEDLRKIARDLGRPLRDVELEVRTYLAQQPPERSQ
jgi:pyridinium-3,5-bisthiocarboxylic acid mononucleotide nickel chelatase